VIPREGVERIEMTPAKSSSARDGVIPREGVERWGYGLAYQLVTRQKDCDPERGS